ncbi:MAG: hypothetical protein HUU57_11225 [Bdellovibrio sp.]|nr:hypothetical protein [Bdellovibrio sp.]
MKTARAKEFALSNAHSAPRHLQRWFALPANERVFKLNPMKFLKPEEFLNNIYATLNVRI